MKKTKIFAMAMAAMMSVGAMWVNALAEENSSETVMASIEQGEVNIDDKNLLYIGRMLVVYNGEDLYDMIPIENEDDQLSVQIDDNQAKLYTEENILTETVNIPVKERSSNLDLSAKALFIYTVTGNDVCLRESFPNGPILDYLQNGMLFGSEMFSASTWVYGYVVDDLDYYSYSIEGYTGYVWGAYLYR